MTTAALQLTALGVLTGWCVLVLSAGALVVVRWARLRGMGRGPMFSGSRATCPAALGGAPLARLPVVSLRPTVKQGAVGRVKGPGAQTRPVASDQACSDSRLRDKRAVGAPALRCAHGEGGDSGEKQSFLEELTPQPLGLGFPALRCAHGEGGDSGEKQSFLEELAPKLPRPGFPELLTPSGRATGVCASRKGRGLCPSPACPATCAHGGRQSECGQVPDRDSGRPHLHGVVGVLVHTGATGGAFDRLFGFLRGMSL